jgi:hypothetical protein
VPPGRKKLRTQDLGGHLAADAKEEKEDDADGDGDPKARTQNEMPAN